MLQSAIASQLDNTALNAVRLLCSDGTEAITAEGEKGLWTDILKCQGHGNDYIVGVRIKSEKWLGVGRRLRSSTHLKLQKKLGGEVGIMRDTMPT